MYKAVSDLHVGSYINCKDLILYKKDLHSLVNALFVIYLIGNMTQIHLNILLNKHFFFEKDDGEGNYVLLSLVLLQWMIVYFIEYPWKDSIRSWKIKNILD